MERERGRERERGERGGGRRRGGSFVFLHQHKKKPILIVLFNASGAIKPQIFTRVIQLPRTTLMAQITQ